MLWVPFVDFMQKSLVQLYSWDSGRVRDLCTMRCRDSRALVALVRLEENNSLVAAKSVNKRKYSLSS